MRCADVARVVLCVFVLGAAVSGAPRPVAFRASDGYPLSAVYYEPAVRPAPGVVLLPMHRRTSVDWASAAARLAGAGFAVLTPEFRETGNSAELRADVAGAKAFLRTRPEVIAGRLGLAGGSIGANLAVLEAAPDPGVLSMVLLSPGLDYLGLRTEAAMKQYGDRPALLVTSTEDPYARRSVRRLITMGPGVREVRFTDAIAHGTLILEKDPALVDALVDWFRRTLL